MIYLLLFCIRRIFNLTMRWRQQQQAEDAIMINRMDELLTAMKTKYQHDAQHDSRHYKEVNMGQEAAELGFEDITEKLAKINAIIPLKNALHGMKVRIDGRTFVNYVQFDSGVTLPGHAVGDTQLPHKQYAAQDSMIFNFS